MKTARTQQLPQRIGFNVIDRIFLIPETDDVEGPHFPMSVATPVRLKQPIAPEVVRAALQKVEHKFPQLRLGYMLDYHHYCWRRVPDDQLPSYLDSLVQVDTSDSELTDLLSNMIRTNTTPLSQPIQLFLHDRDVILKVNHVLGDGTFIFTLVYAICLAALNPAAFEEMPELPPIFGLSAWQLIFQSRKQASIVFRGWFKLLSTYTKRDTSGDLFLPVRKGLAPVVSGSPMGVVLKTISPEILATLRKIKSGFSVDMHIALNTVLYVLLQQRLVEMGFIGTNHHYTFPVDLRRYLKHPLEFHPGNLLGQLRIIVGKESSADLITECNDLQSKLDHELETLKPLVPLPMAWLMGLVGNKFYNKMNRDELLNSPQLDPRFFMLTNLGNLTLRAKKFAEFIDLAHGMYIVVPLMGGPHLIVSFNMVAGQGNMGLTYDPRVLTEAQIHEMLMMFTQEWLTNQLKKAVAAHGPSTHQPIKQRETSDEA